MRLLADENFPSGLIELLRLDGHDVKWVRTDYPRYPDAAVLEIAEADGRIVLTLDKDYIQIARQRRIPIAGCGVVLFRDQNANERMLSPLIRTFLNAQQQWTGRVHVITAAGIEAAF
jgi:predicted nuclease of predicted toxin-antitoxin system